MRQAVERNFEIIGESISRLARTDADIAARIGDHRPRNKRGIVVPGRETPMSLR